MIRKYIALRGRKKSNTFQLTQKLQREQTQNGVEETIEMKFVKTEINIKRASNDFKRKKL